MILLAAMLVACQAAPVPPVTVNVPAEEERMPVVQPAAQESAPALQRAQQLRQILARAQQSLARDRLLLPEQDSAYYWYRKALRLDSDNAEAHWGMRKISERYLVLAAQAYERGARDQAEQLLQRALRIAASPADVAALRQRYPAPVVRDNAYLLAPDELAARSDKLVAYLAGLAELARAKDSRLQIVARSDEEGRWIYQQMRAAVEGYRLRGNISVGSSPRVVLIDMDA